MKIENSLINRSNIPVERPVERINSVKATQPVKETANPESENNQEKIPVEELNKKITSVNKFLEASHTNIKFQFHDKLNEYYVAIIDSNTQEVVKEIPPKKFLDLYANMLETIGIIVDQKI